MSAALLLPLLLLFPCAILGAPIDPPSDLVVRDYPSALATRDIVQTFTDSVSNLADGVSKDDIAQGILPDFFRNIPGADKIKSQLGLSDAQIAALPLEFLNIPWVLSFPIYLVVQAPQLILTPLSLVAMQITLLRAGTSTSTDWPTSSHSRTRILSPTKPLTMPRTSFSRILTSASCSRTNRTMRGI